MFEIKDYIERYIGEECWIDLEGIESDAQFVNVINKAINNAEVFLFMYSKSHAEIIDYENDWTVREINFAQKKCKRIVFVNLDKTLLSDWFELMFGLKQQIDASNEFALTKLCEDLKIWLNSLQPEIIDSIVKVEPLLTDEHDKLFVVEKSDKYGYIDKSGKLIIPIEYDNIKM